MSEDIAIHPFRIDIPAEEAGDLHERLARTRWPDPLPGAGLSYGVPGDHLRELVRASAAEYR